MPVAELPVDTRAKLTFEEGDFALTRARSRAASRIIDARAAEFVREFEQPTTFVKAVIRFAQARGVSPEEMFEEAFPLLERLVGGGFLLPEAEAKMVDTTLQIGDTIGRWTITAVINVMEDIEVHQARSDEGFAALKIERPGAAASAHARMREREARVLQALAGKIAPMLLEQGRDNERSFLAIEWCAGVDAAFYAAELRKSGERAALLDLCRNIVRSYADLHDRGFLHGDVHLRNLLVTETGDVRLIDFGYGTAVATPDDIARPQTRLERGGIGFFFEPELAATMLSGQTTPPSTPAGEQYAVAAVLYALVTGAHYLDFSLERNELLRQVCSESPLPFTQRGAEPWPELEPVLSQALRKPAADRYPSMRAMLEALMLIATTPKLKRAAPPASKARSLLKNVSDELRTSLNQELAVPKSSLFYGAAGVASALYRLALLRDSPTDLAMADAWLTRAELLASQPDAFLDSSTGLTEKMAGPVSVYHSQTGLTAMRALIAHAQGNEGATREACARFVTLAGRSTELSDLAFGRAGVLVAAAMLGDVLADGDAARDDVAGLGMKTLESLWRELDLVAPLDRSVTLPNLGMAHGWCGYAFAALRFCRTFGRPHPASLGRRFDELLAIAEPWGRGLRWPWSDGGENVGTMPGWCNGSAGFVQLFTLAHRETGERRFLDAATGAAWNVWEAGGGNGSLCCGEAGRAYALLSLSRELGGNASWLARAQELGERAAASILTNPEKRLSLFKSRVGVALLAADLEHPQDSAFPFLEDEGWR